jgi:hypothetical protein
MILVLQFNIWYGTFLSVFWSFLCKSTVQFNSRFFSSAREIEYAKMCDCSQDRCLLCFASSEDRCVLCWLACIFSLFFSFLSKLQLCTGFRRYYTISRKEKKKKENVSYIIKIYSLSLKKKITLNFCTYISWWWIDWLPLFAGSIGPVRLKL